jgi:hypothetical protein
LGASVLLSVIDFNFNFWFFLILIFFVFLIADFKKTVVIAFPLGSILAITYFVDNVFALCMLKILKGDGLLIGENYYLEVPMEDYLPFAFISSQLFLMGYQLIAKPVALWGAFIQNIKSTIKLDEINIVIAIGVSSAVLGFLRINALNQVTHVLSNFTTCGLFAIGIYNKSFKNKYLIGGFLLQLTVISASGMFGGFMVFVAYFALMMLLIYTSSGKRISWSLMLFIIVIGVVFLAALQHTKNNYRAAVWREDGQASLTALSNASNQSTENASIFDKAYYYPILERLNQGWLVSATMEKIPKEQPFENGSTLMTAIINSLVPRLLNPDKETAGGWAKMAKFTNIKKNNQTSMNIGLLGEAYINFGKFGAPFWILFYGIVIGFFEKKLLNYSLKKPLVLLLFPVFFEPILGSGTDFLIVFNGIVKNSMIVAFVLYFINQRLQAKTKKGLA